LEDLVSIFPANMMRKVIDDKLQQLRARDSEEAEQIVAEEEIKSRVTDADVDANQDGQ